MKAVFCSSYGPPEVLEFKEVGILGSVLAGEVESVGAEVRSLKPGDRVYGSGSEMGSYAEFACRPEDGPLARIPESLSYVEAATVHYGALTALYFLKEKAGGINDMLQMI